MKGLVFNLAILHARLHVLITVSGNVIQIVDLVVLKDALKGVLDVLLVLDIVQVNLMSNLFVMLVVLLHVSMIVIRTALEWDVDPYAVLNRQEHVRLTAD